MIAVTAIAVMIMAGLFAAVGHGGGSGYLAVFALTGMPPEQMRPAALLLNLIVASLATWRFADAGAFRKDLFIPLVCASVPAAFVGGWIAPDPAFYRIALGVALSLAAVRLVLPRDADTKHRRAPVLLLVMCGAGIGLFAGFIGIGGGVLLSPIILLAGWADARQTAAVSAPFILVNSAAALGGILLQAGTLHVSFSLMAPLIVAVLIGGAVGAQIGSNHLGQPAIRRCLAVVLVIAGIKMFLNA